MVRADVSGTAVSVIYVALPASLFVVALAVAAFVWAARRGQFDDLETPALRALHDERIPQSPNRERATDQAEQT